MPQARHIYIMDHTAQPGESLQCTYEAAENEKVAFAAMFGYSNDWFFANGVALDALTKGDVTSKTVLLDDGTAVNQYPGAGNAQFMFNGTVMSEDKADRGRGRRVPRACRGRPDQGHDPIVFRGRAPESFIRSSAAAAFHGRSG